MTIANLDEAQVRPGSQGCGVGSPAERLRLEDSSGHGPEDPGASPSHAFEETAAVNAVFIVVVFYDVWHIASRFKVYWIVFARGTCRASIHTYRPGWLNIPG